MYVPVLRVLEVLLNRADVLENVHLDGIHFSEGMVLSSGQCSGLPDFLRILSVLVNANKVAFLCKRLSS